MYCNRCGKEIGETDKYCVFCGNELGISVMDYSVLQGKNNWNSTHELYENSSFANTANVDVAVVNVVLGKMKISNSIWLVIGIIQIVLGVATLCVGYGLLPIGFGIWNIVMSNRVRKNIEYFKKCPEAIYPYYERMLTNLVVFLVLNIFLGALIGVACHIYELTIRDYVMKHGYALGGRR